MHILFVQQYPDLRSSVLSQMLRSGGHVCSLFHFPAGPATSAPKLFTASFEECRSPEDFRDLARCARQYDLIICRVPSGELAELCASLDVPCLFDVVNDAVPPSARHPLAPPRGLLTTRGEAADGQECRLTLPTGLLRAHLPGRELPVPETSGQGLRVIVPVTFGNAATFLPAWLPAALQQAGGVVQQFALYGQGNAIPETFPELVTAMAQAHAGLLPLGISPDDGRLPLLHAAGLVVLRPEAPAMPHELGILPLHPEDASETLKNALRIRTVQDIRDQTPLLDDAIPALVELCERLARPSLHFSSQPLDATIHQHLNIPAHAEARPDDMGRAIRQRMLRTAGEQGAGEGTADPGLAPCPLHRLDEEQIQAALRTAATAGPAFHAVIPLEPRSTLETQCLGGERSVRWWLKTLFTWFEEVVVSVADGSAHFSCRTRIAPAENAQAMLELAAAWHGATHNRLTPYRAQWHSFVRQLPWTGQLLFIGSNALCRQFYTPLFFGVDTVLHVDPDPNNAPDVVAYGEDLSAFADGSIDGVVYFGTPYVMNAPATFLREAQRVLRPGGLLSGGFNGPAARWAGIAYTPGATKSTEDYWTFSPEVPLDIHPDQLRLLSVQRASRSYSYFNAIKQAPHAQR